MVYLECPIKCKHKVLNGSAENCNNFRCTPTPEDRRIEASNNRLCFRCLKVRRGNHSWRTCTDPVCKKCVGKHRALVCLVQKGEHKVLSTEQNHQDDNDYDDQQEEDFEHYHLGEQDDHTTENPDEDEDDYDDQIQEEQDSLEVMCLTTAFGPESVETECPNEDSESDDASLPRLKLFFQSPRLSNYQLSLPQLLARSVKLQVPGPKLI